MTTANDPALSFDRVKFNYFSIGAGDCTLAYQVDGNKNGLTRKVRFGYAFCSPKDKFAKADVFATTLPAIERDNGKRPVVNGRVLSNAEIPAFIASLPRSKRLVVEGGRSRALNRLNTRPIELTVNIPAGDSPTHHILMAMQECAIELAPNWANKVTLRQLSRNIYAVSRGDQGVMFRLVADERSDHLIEICDASDIRPENLIKI